MARAPRVTPRRAAPQRAVSPRPQTNAAQVQKDRRGSRSSARAGRPRRPRSRASAPRSTEEVGDRAGRWSQLRRWRPTLWPDARRALPSRAGCRSPSGPSKQSASHRGCGIRRVVLQLEGQSPRVRRSSVRTRPSLVDMGGMTPDWRRCSSFRYTQYLRSSRLARGAALRDLCNSSRFQGTRLFSVNGLKLAASSTRRRSACLGSERRSYSRC